MKKAGAMVAAGARWCSPVALILLITCRRCVVCAAPAAADQELTHLRFYFHEVNAGAPSATVVNVASLHKYVTQRNATQRISPTYL
jgi:hypothetical protein